MTLAELLDCDASTLERMTDEELGQHFGRYLTVTRPEKAERRKPSQTVPQFNPTFNANIAKMAELGIDLSYLKRKKR